MREENPFKDLENALWLLKYVGKPAPKLIGVEKRPQTVKKAPQKKGECTDREIYMKKVFRCFLDPFSTVIVFSFVFLPRDCSLINILTVL